jgi:hypothetical protein
LASPGVVGQLQKLYRRYELKGKSVYSWKCDGIIKADPEKIGQEYETLLDRSPKAVVAYAKGHSYSELHKCFEWDIKKAAEKHWLDQARLISRMLMVRLVEEDVGGQHFVLTRAFENTKTEDDASFTLLSIQEIAEDEDRSRQLLNEIARGITSYLEKGKRLSSLMKEPKVFNNSLRRALKAI